MITRLIMNTNILSTIFLVIFISIWNKNLGKCNVQVKRKQSSSGVILGEDVLSLKVEALPQVDHLLIMALVIVYGLINDKL